MAIARSFSRERRERVIAFYEEVRRGPRTYVLAACGYAKIGKTTHLPSRIATLQTGCPEPLSTLACVSHRLFPERAAHEQWGHLRNHLEWFRLTPELEAWAAEVQRRNDEILARCEAAIEGGILRWVPGELPYEAVYRMDSIRADAFWRGARAEIPGRRPKPRASAPCPTCGSTSYGFIGSTCVCGDCGRELEVGS